MHLPEDGNVSCQNMYEVYGVYNILSYVYVHLLVLIPYIIYNCVYMNKFLKLTQMHWWVGSKDGSILPQQETYVKKWEYTQRFVLTVQQTTWLLNMKLWHLLKMSVTICPVTEHITQNLNHQDVINDHEKAYDKSWPGNVMTNSHRKKCTNTDNKSNTTFTLQLKR
jgi:hypothetical protein